MCVTVTVAVLFFLIAAILYFAKGVKDNRASKTGSGYTGQENGGNTVVAPDLTPSPVEKKVERKEPMPLVKRELEHAQPEPIAPTNYQSVVEEPASYAQTYRSYQTESEQAATTIEGPSVAFGVSGFTRKEFIEEYQELSASKKQWCDTLLKEISELEKARVKEGKFARTVLQGQDTIAKLQFVKGEICIDCTIVNPELKTYGKASGTKIKPKPVRFKITDEQKLDAALFTLKVANQTSLEARQKKRAQKKTEEEN
jgi:hypothetical protein